MSPGFNSARIALVQSIHRDGASAKQAA
jgi:hypothetical protein